MKSSIPRRRGLKQGLVAAVAASSCLALLVGTGQVASAEELAETPTPEPVVTAAETSADEVTPEATPEPGMTESPSPQDVAEEPSTEPTPTAQAQAEEGATTQLQPQTTSLIPTVYSVATKPVGQLTNTWGTFPQGAEITVHTQVQLNGSWHTSQTRKADSTGYFVIPLTYGANSPGKYTYRVVGIYPDARTSVSTPFTLTRTASPIVSGVASKPVGQTTYTWGTFPGAENRPVWTEFYINGRWLRSQQTKASGSGAFTIPLTYGINAPGTHTYRVAASMANGSVARSSSRSLVRIPEISAATANSTLIYEPANVWGTAQGAPNSRVWSEVYLNGSWVQSQVRTTSSTGWYKIPLTYGVTAPSNHQYRVAVRYPDGQVHRSKSVTARRHGYSTSQCPTAVNTERGLKPTAVRVLRATCAEFTDLTRYLGYRGSAGSYHSQGRAIDVMVSGPRGWDVAYLLQRHAHRLGVIEIIYEQRIWTVQRADEGWRWMPSRGNPTADHYDHVHISTR